MIAPAVVLDQLLTDHGASAVADITELVDELLDDRDAVIARLVRNGTDSALAMHAGSHAVLEWLSQLVGRENGEDIITAVACGALARVDIEASQ